MNFHLDSTNEPPVKVLAAHHAATPDISVQEHVERLVAELGDSIAGKRKLYLDTRYWIHLREAAMGRAKHSMHLDILEHIRELVATGSVICPVSDAAWLEYSKQTDPQTKMATAVLFDELSLGVAIMSEHDRMTLEIKHLISNPKISTAPSLKDRVWTKAGYVLGVKVPFVSEWSEEHNRLFQKISVDMFWKTTHREMVEVCGESQPVSDRMETTAAKITSNIQRYSHEIRSIQQAYAAESAGVLGAFEGEIGNVIINQFRSKGGDPSRLSKEEIDAATKKMLRGLINAFRMRQKIMAQYAPSIYAYAMCHAAVRWDRSRTVNSHDLIDIHHACSGIPYHDAMFTENPLRVLVTAGNVALDKTFACAVLSKEKEVLNYLRSLLS